MRWYLTKNKTHLSSSSSLASSFSSRNGITSNRNSQGEREREGRGQPAIGSWKWKEGKSSKVFKTKCGAQNSYHWVTIHLGSISSSTEFSGHSVSSPKHGSFSTRSTCEQTFLARRLSNNRVRVRYPLPQDTEHSDHSLQGVVAQDTSPTHSVSQISFSINVTEHPPYLALDGER